MLRVFVPRERARGEQRVAATPETVRQQIKSGLQVQVEAGAGESAHLADSDYTSAGATLGPDGWESADIVLKVAAPEAEEAARLRSGALLIGFLAPYRNTELIETLASRGVTALAMELLPRITRAQPMDALSSQASIAGYKAVLIAASRLDKYFPLLMTAAGTIAPARVVIMGAGVAGLQAVATAKRLGAIVEVSDVRAGVQEQVESLGGRFIELPMRQSGEGAGGYAREMEEDFLRKQRAIVARHTDLADVVITTALVPGKKAPVLLTEEMVRQMRDGAVVVDLAADSGGNCELTVANEEVVRHGVTILGYSNLAATMPRDASMLYARNVQALLLHLWRDGALHLDFDDEITSATVLTHGGEVRRKE